VYGRRSGKIFALTREKGALVTQPPNSDYHVGPAPFVRAAGLLAVLSAHSHSEEPVPAAFVVVGRVIDPSTEARESGGECIETLLHFFDRNVFLVRRNRPCAAEWIEDAPFP
jgi:hypothetical protein